MERFLKCSICEKELCEGEEAFKLRGCYICTACEKLLVGTALKDDGYFFLKEKIKNIWFAM